VIKTRKTLKLDLMKAPQNYQAPYQNPLHLPTWIFLQKVGDLYALIHESVVIKNTRRDDSKNETYRMIGTTTITTYDLAIEQPQTLGPETRILRPITNDHYIALLDNILVRENAYAIAQVYEYFESFLYDILAFYQLAKNERERATSGSFEDLRENLKKTFRSRNNIEVLKMIRSESEFYRSHEINKTLAINLIDWNAVFSLARHSITHSNLIVKTDAFEHLQPHQKDLFRKKFPLENVDNELTLRPTFETLIDTIRMADAHAILIFRGLSKNLELDSFPVFPSR
jgi:hypothetical protein